MERIREEEKRLGELRRVGREHAHLPPSVRQAAQDHAPRSELTHRMHGRLETSAVAGRTGGRRGPCRSRLAEGQVAAEDVEARRREGTRYRHEERRAAVSSGPVGEDEALAAGAGGRVQKAADGRLAGRVRVEECEVGWILSHGVPGNGASVPCRVMSTSPKRPTSFTHL